MIMRITAIIVFALLRSTAEWNHTKTTVSRSKASNSSVRRTTKPHRPHIARTHHVIPPHKSLTNRKLRTKFPPSTIGPSTTFPPPTVGLLTTFPLSTIRHPTTFPPPDKPELSKRFDRGFLRYYSLIHGCIMYIAVSFLLAPSLLFSLYFNDLWQDRGWLGNRALWYQVHRGLAYLFFIVTLLGSGALVLLHSGHIKAWINGRDDAVTNLQKRHHISMFHGYFGFGGVVISLLLIPLATMVCCTKGSRSYHIYTYVHYGIGGIGFLFCQLAVLCALFFFSHIFSSMELSWSVGVVHILTALGVVGALQATVFLQDIKQADDTVDENGNESRFVPDVVFQRMRQIIFAGYLIQTTINLIFIVILFVYGLSDNVYYEK